jgi:5-methyltetrahydropteroyltriglutamate--homocysteine methyltransferase
MATFKKYTTTVVGAHSVPRWHEELEKLVESGKLGNADMADAQSRASQAALLDLEAAGIDIVNGGEMHRRMNNRYAPLNAMLNFFWNKIPAFQGETRPNPVTAKDPDVTHPAAVCHGKISDDTDLGLVDEFKMVTMLADRNVKVTMTGPRMLAKVAWAEYYDGLPNMMQDLGKLMKRNFRKLKRASCKFVQIDEPLFIISDDNEVKAAVDAINIAIEGVNMAVMTHICQGN